MPLLLPFFLIFLAGLATKLADDLTDRPSPFRQLSFVAALAYGLLGGYLISLSSEFATLFLAVVAAMILAGKVDCSPHILAIIAIIASPFFFGLPPFNLSLLALLALFAFLDEPLSDFAESRIEASAGINKMLLQLAGARLLLDAACFVLSIALNNWLYFIAIVLFDLGYFAAERAFRALWKRP